MRLVSPTGGLEKAWSRLRRLMSADRGQIRALLQPSFDASFYITRYRDIARVADPLAHYISHGWREMRDPTPWFSTRRYLELHADVKAAGVDPFYHYLRWGRTEGREIRPAEIAAPRGPQISDDLVEAAIAKDFDPAFYRKAYPDIVRNKLDPLKHYVGFGWREGRDPCAWFSTRGYLALHPDVRDNGINPLYHFLTIGKVQGRSFVPPAGKSRAIAKDPAAMLVRDPALRDIAAYRETALAPPSPTFDPGALDIHWVVPDFAPGGGGHMTIFRMVRWLELFGHRCTVWITNPGFHAKGRDPYETMVLHFQSCRAELKLIDESFATEAAGDVIIATSWETVAPVMAAAQFKERFYFVQDFEPSFHPMGSRSIAANETYRRDIACLCASTWLKGLMEERYGRWARHFNLAADPSVYKPVDRAPNAIPRIAFYSRTSTPRRAVELGLLALEELARRGVAFHVDFFGAALDILAAPFEAVDHGVLAVADIAGVYQGADIGVCFSSTNYSLVPQEMMACGLPVVELDGESTRAVFPAGVVTLAGPDPIGIADALEALLLDEARRKMQAQTALAWVGQFTWEGSARDIEAAIVERLTGKDFSAAPNREPAGEILLGQATAPHIVRAPAPHASVVIPTWNGGEVWRDVLATLRRQRAPWPFEIVVIDSGSSDGSADVCRDQPDIALYDIPQAEFGHGRTRNLGVQRSRGAFVAFLTQDAKPVGDTWLYDLVTALERRPDAAGAFGRHTAWPSASAFTKREIERHFARFQRLPLVVSAQTSGRPFGLSGIAWEQVLHFYSDNNSCLRRDVWEQIPYPDIEYGEDQVWARDIIAAGYEKVYAPRAEVLHSHDYDAAQTFERARTEARFFMEHFEYELLKGALEDALSGLNRADSEWGEANGVPAEEIARQMTLNGARLKGYIAGQQEAKIGST